MYMQDDKKAENDFLGMLDSTTTARAIISLAFAIVYVGKLLYNAIFHLTAAYVKYHRD